MLKTFSYNRIANFYETDAAKIVHFSNYFKYVEEAEQAFIASLPNIDCCEDIWMRSDLACDYLMPIRFDEAFRVDLSVISADQDSIHYEFCILIEDDVSAKGYYKVKTLSYCNETKLFHKKEISRQLISAING